MTTTLTERDAPIISVECNEPEGTVVRNVYFMPFTRENLVRLWDESRKFKTLFSNEIRQNFKKFAEVFLRNVGNEIEATGIVYVVDDFVGVFYMTRIVAGIDASVHYSFFDRRHKGRENLIKEMLRYGFERYGFRRMSTEVPLYATPATFNFIENLGFIKEGRIRKCVEYEGQWWDTNIYGILRNEVIEDGR